MITTQYLVIGLALTIGAIDLYLYVTRGNAATISYAILTLALLHPIVPFMFGMLAGHLFWPQCPKGGRP
jgi:hypothetical protein